MNRASLPAPRAGRDTRLAVAAAMWTVVGLGLGFVGAGFLVGAGAHWGWFVAAPCVGALKARFALARRAGRNAARIAASAERSCVFGAFSWPMWGLVAFFMALGGLLRHSSAPRAWIGGLYLAVGVGLAGASLVSWRLWYRARGARGRST